MACRQCTVTIQNKTSSFTLCNPRVHLYSRNCESHLPPVLRPTESGTVLFIKKPKTACGSVGVFTYKILQESNKQDHGRLAVMFSVPYDFNVYANHYAVGEFRDIKQCDKELYKEMYYASQRYFI